jgi:hypothetical protein
MGKMGWFSRVMRDETNRDGRRYHPMETFERKDEMMKMVMRVE